MSIDSLEFDPIAYINEKFPSEASLDGLDGFVTSVHDQIKFLDEELSKSVQTQSTAGKQAIQDLSCAQEAIVELCDKIAEIKQQASQSEKMVQEICADIKKLDCAKKHLQTSITAMKNLQMIIKSVDELEIFVKNGMFREAANHLDVVKQLMTQFQKYTAIPLIYDINNRIQAAQFELRKRVHVAFQEIGQLVDGVADSETIASDNLPTKNFKSLSECCEVVDAIGLDARSTLLEEFIRLQLLPYERLFGPDRPHNALSNTDRRWAWFKRIYKHLELRLNTAVFPPHWNVLFRIAIEFIKMTKMHMIHALEQDSSSNNSDVQVLIQALQSTIRFESDLSRKFEEIQRSQPKFVTLKQVLAASGGGNNTTSNPAAGTPGKQQQQPIPSNRTPRRSSIGSSGSNSTTPNPYANTISAIDMGKCCDVEVNPSIIVGNISNEFDRFLGPYVSLERRNLEDMLQRLSTEEDNAQQDTGNNGGSDAPVYGSAMSMFAFIKGSIKRCTALTNGQTFLMLCKEFRTCLTQYAESLRSRCIAPQTISANNVIYKLPLGAEVGLCYLINTGEYCAEVVPQLEGLIKSKMMEEFANKLDMNAEVELFLDLVAYIMKALVGGILDRCEGAFREINSKSWSSMTEFGEDNNYIQNIKKILQDIIPVLRKNLGSTYFKNICTKLITELQQRFLDVITKQRRLSDAGCQQLLLDVDSLKRVLLQLPNMNGSDDAIMTPQEVQSSLQTLHGKLVATKIGYIESILKLVALPESLIAERFHTLWPNGMGNINELYIVLNLKGVTRKQDQQKILEAVGLLNSSNGNAGNSGSGISPSVSTDNASVTAGIGIAVSGSSSASHTPSISGSFGSGSGSGNTGFLPSLSVSVPSAASITGTFSAAAAAAPQAFSSGVSAASSASASMVSSSIKIFSQDYGITSSARNAVGNMNNLFTSSNSGGAGPTTATTPSSSQNANTFR